MSLDNNAKSEINKYVKIKIKELENEKISKDDKLLISDFKNRFIICEKAYKHIELKVNRFESKTIKIKDIKLKIDNIKKYLNEKMEYNIDENLLDNLFGSNKNRNNMSVKKLRDSFCHDIKKNDIKELKSRKKELFKFMNDFIKAIKKQKVN